MKDTNRNQDVGEEDKRIDKIEDDSNKNATVEDTSVASGSFESCIDKYIRCIDTSVANIHHEKCKTTFHSCSLSILSNSSLEPDEHVQVSNPLPEENNENKTIIRGKKLSRKLYNCIKSFSSCMGNKVGNCARTYQSCTLDVFDQDIQGRNSASGNNLDNVDSEPESGTETATEVEFNSTPQTTASSINHIGMKEDHDMQAYPDMDILDPSSEYLKKAKNICMN